MSKLRHGYTYIEMWNLLKLCAWILLEGMYSMSRLQILMHSKKGKWPAILLQYFTIHKTHCFFDNGKIHLVPYFVNDHSNTELILTQLQGSIVIYLKLLYYEVPGNVQL